MNQTKLSIEDILEICLERLENGESYAQLLAEYPHFADEIEALLEVANWASTINPPEIMPAQIQNIQKQISAKQVKTPARGNFLQGAIAGFILAILLLGGVYTAIKLNQSEESTQPILTTEEETEPTPFPTDEPTRLTSEAEIILATEEVTLTPSPSPTETDEPTPLSSETATLPATEEFTPTPSPSPTETDEPTITVEQETSPEEAFIPVAIQFTGEVEGIDEEAGAILVDGVMVQTDLANLPLNLNDNPQIQVIGELQDDGTVLSEQITPTGENESELTTACQRERCHPVLTLLSVNYEIPYDELENWHRDGLGMGEIARILALAEGNNISANTIKDERLNGASWSDLQEQYPSPPTQQNLGQTIQQSGPPSEQGGNNAGNPAPPPQEVPSNNNGNSSEDHGRPESPGNSNPPPHSNSGGQGNR